MGSCQDRFQGHSEGRKNLKWMMNHILKQRTTKMLKEDSHQNGSWVLLSKPVEAPHNYNNMCIWSFYNQYCIINNGSTRIYGRHHPLVGGPWDSHVAILAFALLIFIMRVKFRKKLHMDKTWRVPRLNNTLAPSQRYFLERSHV